MKFKIPIIGLLATGFGIIASMNGIAEVPGKAVISKIYGQKELWIRRNGRPTPAQIGSTLQKYFDSLLVNGNAKTHAILKFFSNDNHYLNLFVKTIIHPKSAIYFFPCTIQSGSHLFGWGLASKLGRGCENAIVIRGGNPQVMAPFMPLFAFSHSKEPILVAQNFARQVNYCSVVASNGQSWFDTASGDPCNKPMTECAAASPKMSCVPLTLSYWWTTEPQLTATVECAKNQLFTAQGTGNDIEGVARNLWKQALDKGAKSCALVLYAPNDLVVVPAQNPEVAAAGKNPTFANLDDAKIVFRTKADIACPEVKVYNGAIRVKSAQNIPGTLVPLGNEATTNYCAQSEVKPIDLAEEMKSIDVEVFQADRQGIPFCDEQQASGGQEGDRRKIQLTTTQGTLKIDYEMYTIPDRFQIMYEGRELYDSGFVSGSKQFTVPFHGTSGRLEVILTGNREDSGTKWIYKIACPA